MYILCTYVCNVHTQHVCIHTSMYVHNNNNLLAGLFEFIGVPDCSVIEAMLIKILVTGVYINNKLKITRQH
jgi:hypothetical protein